MYVFAEAHRDPYRLSTNQRPSLGREGEACLNTVLSLHVGTTLTKYVNSAPSGHNCFLSDQLGLRSSGQTNRLDGVGPPRNGTSKTQQRDVVQKLDVDVVRVDDNFLKFIQNIQVALPFEK